MQNPIANIDVNQIPDTGIYIENWFNPKVVEIQQLLMAGIEFGDNRKKILEVYPEWNVEDKVITRTSSDINGSDTEPVYHHVSDNILKYKDNQISAYADDDEVSMVKQFAYVIFDDVSKKKDMKAIGFVSGNFNICGAPDISEKDKNEIEVICYIKAIEIDPEYRGIGLGTTIGKMIVGDGIDFINGALSQIPQEDLDKLSFKPGVESDLTSQSGRNWLNHLFIQYNEQVNEVLPNYVPSSRISATANDMVV